jgi:hypothetical protein
MREPPDLNQRIGRLDRSLLSRIPLVRSPDPAMPYYEQ